MKNSNIPIIKHINDFLDYCEVEKGLANKTQENYQHYLQKFVSWVKKTKKDNLLPHELTADDIWAYRLYLSRYTGEKGHSLKKVTQNYYLIALRALLGYFTAKDIISLPADKIVLPKDAKAEKTVKFLNLDQIEKLLLASDTNTRDGLRDRAILESFFSTGLRIAELVALNREQFTNIKDKKDLELGIIGKGSHPRTVYFSERALSWLKKYLESRKDKEKALFIHYKARKDAENRLTARSIERIVKKYAILGGIPIFTTPHTLRHCLHPLTRIITSGSVISAQELFFNSNQNLKVQSINWRELNLENAKIISKSYHINPFYNIWADGYNIICSPNHRFFTIGSHGIKEIKAKDLKTGDWIMGIKKVNLRGKKFLGPELSRLAGYILGDGTISKRGRCVIINDKNKKFLEYYRNIANRLFNIKTKIVKEKRFKTFRLKIYHLGLVDFLLNLKFKEKSNQKQIPKEIISSTKKELAEFIAGFYDAEGNSGTIRIFSSSLNLLKDIQVCLLRFGIDSHIDERERTVMLPQKRYFSHKFYTLNILHKPDQLRFIKNIKTLKRKFLKTEPNFYGEKLPIGKLLTEIKRDTDSKKIFWSNKLKKNHKIKHVARYYSNLSPVKKTVKKIIKQLEKLEYSSPLLKNLKQISYSNTLKWLRIKEKIKLPSARYCSYDFGVNQKYSNLITDGIISHNSYATDLLTQGVDIRTIQEFLGHRSILTTQIYTHVTNKRLRDIHRKFHSGKNLKE